MSEAQTPCGPKADAVTSGLDGLQVAYVVVSSGWDRHAQMAWVSAHSVRLQEPQARIVILVEGTSEEATESLVARFSGIANSVLVQHSGPATAVAKSRLHKMRLRHYFRGDLLYLDSDTIAVGPIHEILSCEGQVGAVMDFNHPNTSTWFPPELEGPFRQLGWEYPLPRYLNAGVILLRDVPSVYTFCEEWIERFQASTVLPHVWDQATFNSALCATDVRVGVLPHGYNSMVVKRNYRFRRARILHFFGSPDEQQGTLMEHLLAHVDRTGQFDREAYERSIRQGHPWGPAPEPWQLVHSRNYARAAVVKSRQALKRALRRLSNTD